MSDAAKPTASQREALIADLSDGHNPAPGHREWCPKCRAAAELSRLAARVAELEGAAITDDAVMDALDLVEADIEHGDFCDEFSSSCTRIAVPINGVRRLIESLRSESHQASAGEGKDG